MVELGKRPASWESVIKRMHAAGFTEEQIEGFMTTMAPPRKNKELPRTPPRKGTPIAIGGDKGVIEVYGLDGQTVRNWADRGWVKVLQEGRRGKGGAALYDEHDIYTVIKTLGAVTEGKRTDLFDEVLRQACQN
jgi:hypothetical protein